MIHRDPSPFAPIPGTQPTRKALFIDRWGTLLRLPEQGFVKSFQDVEFAEGALDALFRATQAKWQIYLVGNEDAVARGKVTDEEWEDIDQGVLANMAEHGARVKRNYVCLDDPENGVQGRQKDSVYMLPNTGAFYHAFHTDGIELRTSWVIGDSTLELVAGWRAGLRLAGVRTGLAVEDEAFEVTPEFMADDLAQAILSLLSLEGALHP